jgi:hypothetical protein
MECRLFLKNEPIVFNLDMIHEPKFFKLITTPEEMIKVDKQQNKQLYIYLKCSIFLIIQLMLPPFDYEHFLQHVEGTVQIYKKNNIK